VGSGKGSLAGVQLVQLIGISSLQAAFCRRVCCKSSLFLAGSVLAVLASVSLRGGEWKVPVEYPYLIMLKMSLLLEILAI
jgi:hypothetical protein